MTLLPEVNDHGWLELCNDMPNWQTCLSGMSRKLWSCLISTWTRLSNPKCLKPLQSGEWPYLRVSYREFVHRKKICKKNIRCPYFGLVINIGSMSTINIIYPRKSTDISEARSKPTRWYGETFKFCWEDQWMGCCAKYVLDLRQVALIQSGHRSFICTEVCDEGGWLKWLATMSAKALTKTGSALRDSTRLTPVNPILNKAHVHQPFR